MRLQQYRKRVRKLDLVPLLVAIASAGVLIGVRHLVRAAYFPAAAVNAAPLWDAMEHNDVRAVSHWLKQPGNDPNVRNTNGEPAVFIAIQHANLPMTQLFIKDARFDPNVCDGQGRTPLMSALETDKLELVRALSAHPKTDFTRTDSNGDALYLHSRSARMLAFIRSVHRQPDDEPSRDGSDTAVEEESGVCHMSLPSPGEDGSLVIAETGDEESVLLDMRSSLGTSGSAYSGPRIYITNGPKVETRSFAFGSPSMWLPGNRASGFEPEGYRILGERRMALFAGEAVLVFQYRDCPKRTAYGPTDFSDNTNDQLTGFLTRLSELRFTHDATEKDRKTYVFSSPLVSTNVLAFFQSLLQAEGEIDVSDPSNQKRQEARDLRFREEFARFLNRRTRQWATSPGYPDTTLYAVTSDSPPAQDRANRTDGAEPPHPPGHLFYGISLWVQERNYALYAERRLKDAHITPAEATELRERVNGLLLDILFHNGISSTDRRPSTFLVDATQPDPDEAQRLKAQFDQGSYASGDIVEWLRTLCTGSRRLVSEADTGKEYARFRFEAQEMSTSVPASIAVEVERGGEPLSCQVGLPNPYICIVLKDNGKDGDVILLWRSRKGQTMGVVKSGTTKKILKVIRVAD